MELTEDHYRRAAVAYNAYCKQTGGKSLVSGEQLPAFDALNQRIKDAWAASAIALSLDAGVREDRSAKSRADADHIWHVWLNSRNRTADAFDHSMYEFKSMLAFLGYGADQIEEAYTGKLRTTHRQCSRCEPEKIEGNKLSCALGKDVTECEILLSIRDTFNSERDRECGVLGKHYANVPDREMFRVMANTCAWHMYTDPVRTGRFIDTSEGWLTDVSDRMFWSRVYDNMAQSDPDYPTPESETSTDGTPHQNPKSDS